MGVIGVFLIEGLQGLIVISTVIWDNAYSISLLAVTAFILMGNLIVYHNIGQDIYDVAYKWLGWFKELYSLA
jgi:TRAP-type C4-dicarboxylate transport system permease large subunit